MKILSVKNLGVLKDLIRKYGDAKVVDVIDIIQKEKEASKDA